VSLFRLLLPHLSRSLPLAVGVVALLLTSGCWTNRSPRFDMSSGEPEQIRRYTGRPETDYIFRWGRNAFTQVRSDLDIVMTGDRLDVLTRHGRPDYVREGVKGWRNESFDEWVYWDRNTIVQFIQDELVFEGPLLDSDRHLVLYGFPTRAYTQQYEVGPRREIWIYADIWKTRTREYSFSDGKLVYQVNY
jgi:hypothetical protein